MGLQLEALRVYVKIFFAGSLYLCFCICSYSCIYFLVIAFVLLQLLTEVSALNWYSEDPSNPYFDWFSPYNAIWRCCSSREQIQKHIEESFRQTSTLGKPLLKMCWFYMGFAQIALEPPSLSNGQTYKKTILASLYSAHCVLCIV